MCKCAQEFEEFESVHLFVSLTRASELPRTSATAEVPLRMRLQVGCSLREFSDADLNRPHASVTPLLPDTEGFPAPAQILGSGMLASPAIKRPTMPRSQSAAALNGHIVWIFG